MVLPKAISTWFMILFFLFVGLGYFGILIPTILLGILALGAAIFLFMGR